MFIKSFKKEKLIQRLTEVNLGMKHSSGKLTGRCCGKENVNKTPRKGAIKTDKRAIRNQTQT